jgi:hypothetical protein
MSQALNGASAGLGLISFIFFTVGCFGYSSYREGIIQNNWINYKIEFDDDITSQWTPKVYVGLQKSLIDITSGYSKLFPFNSCADSGDDYYDDGDRDDMCNVCYRNGRSTFGLIVVSTVLAFIVTCLSGATAASPNAPLTYVNLVCSFISGLFGVIGFGLFMHSCYNKLDDATTDTLHYGPGAIMTLIAFLAMWVVIVLQIAVAALGAGNKA